MKVFISLPMNGKTDKEIKETQDKAIKAIKSIYNTDDVEKIESFLDTEAPEGLKEPGLWYLGESIKLLADADLAVFVEGWSLARGCIVEYEACKKYGIDTYYLPEEIIKYE